jgi:hypothetical protein
MLIDMLTLRPIGPNDYSVHEDGQPIGGIRYASERMPGSWHWHVTLNIPGPPFGDAKTIDEAKQGFKGGMARVQGQARAGAAGEGLRRNEPRQPA